MSNELTLHFTRQIAASPANVWRCWTEPELLKQWFAPRPVITTEAEIDARPGGRFRTVMEVPEHGRMAGDPGCVLLATPAQRLVWTNALGPEFHPNAMGDGPMDFAFTADIRMSARNGGCHYEVSVYHATPAGAETHKNMGFYDGWGTAATQMEAVATHL